MYKSSRDSFYDEPVEIVLEGEAIKSRGSNGRMLPYEITADEYQMLQDDGAQKKRQKRGVLCRLLGGSSTRC